ncbi:MAG: hypothetical protein IKO40_01635 [Kiritimatiellae bacterium]|nr:hypothetical protein [Kiritimatiellia bacterium]
MRQRLKCKAAAMAAAVAALAVALPASGAMTSTLGGIRLNTAPLPAVISTPAALDELSNWRIGWGAGETVTATAPDATITTLADNAAEAGTSGFSLRVAGNWTLYNSGEGTVNFTIAASAFAPIQSQPSGAIAMDTVGQGPDRAAKAGQTPPVAYSGDDWRGNASAASTLTFTPPMGAATTQNLSGTGATAFQFRQPGAWTVQLAMASGSPLSAIINIEGIPTRLNFR